MDYSLWGCKASNMTERLTPFSEAAGVLGPDQGGAQLTVASDSPVREKSADRCPQESRHRLLSQQDCEGWSGHPAGPLPTAPVCPAVPSFGLNAS